MFERWINKSGYRLIDKGNGVWQMRAPHGNFTGSMKQVCTYAVLRLGFQLKELEYAVITMELEFHDCAEFGVMKSFMYTTDTQENENEQRKIC